MGLGTAIVQAYVMKVTIVQLVALGQQRSVEIATITAPQDPVNPGKFLWDIIQSEEKMKLHDRIKHCVISVTIVRRG